MPGEERPEKTEKQVVIGMICSFELTNLDLSRTVSLACNARAYSSGSPSIFARGSLTDSSGIVWQLGTLRGLSIVAGGYDENPTKICSILRNGEQSGSVSDYSHRRGYWYGDFTTLGPGKSTRATFYVSCLNENNTMRGDGSVPASFALETELVMGVHDAATTGDVESIPWTLENLVIDQVNITGN
jgi:hypothetical protein